MHTHLIILALLAPAALAQTSPSPASAPKPQTVIDVLPDEPEKGAEAPKGGTARHGGAAPLTFGTEPLRMPSLGLTIYVPDGARATTYASGGAETGIIAPTGAPTWSINIRRRTSSDKELTVEKIIDASIQQLLESAAANVTDKDNRSRRERVTSAQVLDREPEQGRPGIFIQMQDRQLPIARCYVQLPPSHVAPAPIVTGVCVVKIAPGNFCVFELSTSQPNFGAARAVFEATIASASFEDSTNASIHRGAMVQAGLKLLEQVSPADWEAIIAAQPVRWERLYKPGKTGKSIDDEEVGYRRIRLERGPRSKVTARNMKGHASASTDGYILRIDARLLDGARIIDTQSTFFMSPDREEEVWSIAMGIKEATGKTSHTETGARSGGVMTVQVDSPGAAPQTTRPTIAGDGYICRVEAFLLPQLLARKSMPAAYGWYAFNSQSQLIQFRSDAMERAEAGQWRIVTRVSEDQPATSAVYSAEGELIRSSMPQGVIGEPTTLEKLSDLWKKKGLPLD
ncbi:MAG TPA: hypothetical protein VD971_09405 [Phycisphaerales bacterium]|nr:hypothetical protein [Phycisphaerales bacterium]